MYNSDLVRVFSRAAIFQGLTSAQLATIARYADRAVFQPGQTLIEKDQTGIGALLLIAGDAVRIHDDLHQTPLDSHSNIEIVPEGALVAEMMMLIDTHHTSTVIARSHVRALILPRSIMHEIMRADPTIAEHFIEKIRARLIDLANTLRQIDQGLPLPTVEEINTSPAAPASSTTFSDGRSRNRTQPTAMH